MTTIKHKQATVKLNKTSVVIYYSLKGLEMRFPTGILINSHKDKKRKYIYWDYTNRKLKLPSYYVHRQQDVDELGIRQKTIDDLLTKANAIINDHFQRSIQISPQQLKNLLASQQHEKIQIARTGFFEYFDDFITKKRKHFAAVGNPISLKDYVSTYNLLQDYKVYTNKEIVIGNVNILFLQDLVAYASVLHDKLIGDYEVKTKGAMVSSTVIKRLDILAEFFGYLKALSACNPLQVDVIKNYKRTIKRQPKDKETLTVKEIKAFYNHKFNEPHYEIIKDLFVFLCFTGIRFQDLVDFDKAFIKKQKDGFVYVKKASKTKIAYNIPLSKIVIEILEKYKHKLPSISDQYGNRMIKEALKLTGMFDEQTQQIDKGTNEYKRRYDAITLHKGRNTFITNLVDDTPLNELMKYTGHRKLSTLQSYIDVRRPVSFKYIKEIFD